MAARRRLFVKRAIFFPFIQSGEKDREVRPMAGGKNLDVVLATQEGDVIDFNDELSVLVTRMNEYANIELLLDREPVNRIWPGKSKNQFLAAWRSFYPPHIAEGRVRVFQIRNVQPPR